MNGSCCPFLSAGDSAKLTCQKITNHKELMCMFVITTIWIIWCCSHCWFCPAAEPRWALVCVQILMFSLLPQRAHEQCQCSCDNQSPIVQISDHWWNRKCEFALPQGEWKKLHITAWKLYCNNAMSFPIGTIEHFSCCHFMNESFDNQTRFRSPLGLKCASLKSQAKSGTARQRTYASRTCCMHPNPLAQWVEL